MSRVYTTAQGKQIDIESLRVANEETIAVGNMKVNARGDKLGAGGRVKETRNQTQDSYNKLSTPVPIEINTAEVVQQQIKSGARMTQGAPMPEPQHEPQPEEVNEQIVEPVATASDPVPQMRGSLAASIAAPAVHKQELIKDPRKPVGPARI
jgi:septal ring-binding cell division protein DamX